MRSAMPALLAVAVLALPPALAAQSAEAARSRAASLVATGEADAALAALDRAERDGVPAAELATTRGLALRSVGRLDEAAAAFDRAIDGGAADAYRARLERALLMLRRGEKERARAELDWFIDFYNRGDARTARALTAVGTAARHLGAWEPALFHDAVRAYEEAIAADPSAAEPKLRMGELFLARYDGAEAQSLLAEVLAAEPRNADALLAMARAKRFEGSSDAMALAERALEANPRHAGARAFVALLRLEAGDGAEAAAAARRALEHDPTSRAALAISAAVHLMDGDIRAYRADRDRAFALNPADAEFLVQVAEVAVRRARYAQAVELAERAVALDSLAWDAWSLLGMNQLRIGRVDAARRSLERAFAGDPFNAWTKNTLDLLDRLATYPVRRTDRFELVLHPDEADLLEPYLAGLAEEAYDRLSGRYGYRPETPVRIEVYPRHADFSVRTMGLTGLGALGVAFGNVLAVNSPAAQQPGQFHWGSTVWHEIAHAVTLGLTRHRIPRWLTEGISVHEERRSRPGWGGPPGLDFLQAFEEDRLLPIDRIDEGFIRPTWPGQVVVSYQHASLAVERIERAHGADALRELLERFADGSDTGTAFREALGTTPDAFDAALRDDIRTRHAAGLAAARSLARSRARRDAPAEGAGSGVAAGVAEAGGGMVAGLVRAARVRPDDFAAQLIAGTALFRQGRGAEAEPFLERALELYPSFVEPGSPYALLAEIRLARGDTASAVAALRALAERSETAYEANLELATLLEAAGDPAGAADALERAVWIHPYDPAVHDRLARLAERLDRPALEVRERRAIVALRPVDRAAAYYRLALAHRRAGDATAARGAVLRALEVAPAYAEAQDLLLELSGG